MLGAGYLISGEGGYVFFRKKIICSQNRPQKIVCSIISFDFDLISVGKKFVHLCVRKKSIVDSQQIFPILPETVKNLSVCLSVFLSWKKNCL